MNLLFKYHSSDLKIFQRAAERYEGFYVQDKGDYWLANYRSIITKFPSIKIDSGDVEDMQLRVACWNSRGALFDKTGKLISLSLHKFHNLNEGVENQHDTLDWSSFEVYDKLDGSMLRPAMINGAVRWCTKAGVTHMTPDVEAFVERNPEYQALANAIMSLDKTPTFEYMAPKHRIVVDYGPLEKMTLLAVRDNTSGAYLSYADLCYIANQYNVSVVQRWEIKPEDDIRTLVAALRNAEGVIIRFPNDHRVKLKGMEYIKLHALRSGLESKKTQYEVCVNATLDDIIPVMGDNHYLIKEVTEMFLMYVRFREYIINTSETFYIQNNTLTRKDYAILGQGTLIKPCFSIAMNRYTNKAYDEQKFMLSLFEPFQEYLIRHL